MRRAGTLILAVLAALLPVQTAVAQQPLPGLDVETVVSATSSVAVLAYGDIDGDGDLDIVVVPEVGGLVIYRNDGDTFTPIHVEQVVGTVRALAVADLDGDGDADIVYSDGASYIRVLHNGGSAVGDGTLWLPTEIGSQVSGFGTGALALEAADLDGDGHMDLAAIFRFRPDDLATTVWLRNDDGTGLRWSVVDVHAPDSTHNQIRVGDLDGDGDLDIVTSRRGVLSDSEIAAHRNDGGGASWTTSVVATTDDRSFDTVFELADVDGDGAPEVISQVARSDSSFVDLVAYDPSPDLSSWQPTTLAERLSVRGSTLGDIDGDGRVDLAVTGLLGVLWFRNTGGGNWPSTQVSDRTDADVITVADVNGDGRDDLVYQVASTLTVALSPADPAAPDWPVRPVAPNRIGRTWSSAAADLDGDGVVDLVTVGRLSDTLAWHRRTHQGWQTTVISDDVARPPDDGPALATTGPFEVVAADVDGDGDLDLVTLTDSLTEVVVFINNGDGSSWERQQIGIQSLIDWIHTLGDRGQGLDVVDVDGDGDLDIITASHQRVLLYRNDGSGNYTEEIIDDPGVATVEDRGEDFIETVDVVDVDGDGHLDIVTSFGGMLRWYANDGTGGGWVRNDLGPLPAADFFTRTVPADLDGDGRTDLLLLGTADQPFGWLRHSGPGQPWPFTPIDVSFPVEDVAPMDLDGDGDTDLVVGGSGFLVTLRNDGDGTSWTPSANLTGSRDIRGVTVADIDGDGLPDVVTTSSADGRVAVNTAAPRPADPTDAAVQISGARFSSAGDARWAVLSRDDVFADTLSATSLTGFGPLLFTPTASLDAGTAAELQRVLAPGATVYLMGGTAALSPAVETAVAGLGLTPVRLAGDSRLSTALAVADEVLAIRGATAPSQVVVARAGSPADNPTAAWADSVSVGTWAADTMTPILLSDTAGLGEETASWLAAHPPQRTVLMGGEAALSAAVEAAVPNPRRIGGANRFDTARTVHTSLWRFGPDAFLLANGGALDGWAYGLAAGGLGADLNRSLLLVETDTVPEDTQRLIGCDPEDEDPEVTPTWPLGGLDLITEQLRATLLTC